MDNVFGMGYSSRAMLVPNLAFTQHLEASWVLKTPNLNTVPLDSSLPHTLHPVLLKVPVHLSTVQVSVRRSEKHLPTCNEYQPGQLRFRVSKQTKNLYNSPVDKLKSHSVMKRKK